MTPTEAQAKAFARKFHETYERLAPSFGYKTQEESAKPWSEVPEQNRRLMEAVCQEVIIAALTAADAQGRRETWEEAAKLVPTNWLDDLLTGKHGIGKPPYDCGHIEQLLRGIQNRIRAQAAQEVPHA